MKACFTCLAVLAKFDLAAGLKNAPKYENL